jgi:hypothetical protein
MITGEADGAPPDDAAEGGAGEAAATSFGEAVGATGEGMRVEAMEDAGDAASKGLAFTGVTAT